MFQQLTLSVDIPQPQFTPHTSQSQQDTALLKPFQWILLPSRLSVLVAQNHFYSLTCVLLSLT